MKRRKVEDKKRGYRKS